MRAIYTCVPEELEAGGLLSHVFLVSDLVSMICIAQIVRLQQQVKDLRRENRKEQEVLVTEFSQQINSLEDDLSQKNEEVSATVNCKLSPSLQLLE